MTDAQKQQWNQMLYALRRISRDYQTPDQLRRSSLNDVGLSFEETLEMSYENIQSDAASACNGIREAKR